MGWGGRERERKEHPLPCLSVESLHQALETTCDLVNKGTLVPMLRRKDQIYMSLFPDKLSQDEHNVWHLVLAFENDLLNIY